MILILPQSAQSGSTHKTNNIGTVQKVRQKANTGSQMEGDMGKNDSQRVWGGAKGSAVSTNLNQVNHRLDCSSETEPCFAAKQTREHVLEPSPASLNPAWHSSWLWLRVALSLQGCRSRKKERGDGGERWKLKFLEQEKESNGERGILL